MEVKKKLPNRTLAQNSYLHLLLGYFGSEYGCSLDEAKIDFYKRTCNRDLFERKMVNKKGNEVTYLRSSAELTTGEMTLSIDRFRNWSASVAGIYLPAANEHQMLIYAQLEIQRNQRIYLVMIETRKTEIRYVTSDPKKMLNMYLAKRVLKTWEESFIDEDTGETVTIERNEILFDRGTLIDQDILAKIRFSMEADGIREVEVSNQNRLAFENENNVLYPHIAQAEIGGKKSKFLLYATGLENACLILKDYIELNYLFGFTLTMVKEFDSCVILTDTLKERKVDDASIAYLKEEITTEEYLDKMDEENQEDEESKPDERKFYQIETKITFMNGENEDERVQTFVVNTFNVDRAMMLITHYLKNKEEECEKQSQKKKGT